MAGESRENPLFRPAARVLLLDDAERLLLFRVVEEPQHPRPLWITAGGGLDPGESYEAAAVRELWEETGIRSAEFGPCVWVRRHVFEFRGSWVDAAERFFVVRVGAPEIIRDNLEAQERDYMPEHRWWTADEIARSSDRFAPRRLEELLPPIIRGEYPLEPIDSGV
jgi:8-oxo-dGTP pyrophosphatase MutT (NUDIX family)